MYVGIARLSVVIGQSHSLKEKRMVLRRIKDRVRERLGVAVNEVADQDNWQASQLGVAVTSGERSKALALIDDLVRAVQSAASAGDAHVVAVAKDVTRFDAEPAPIATVDDRTGAGDKALGGDHWIPDAWKDEV
ncbi:MAG: DUF503 domain-containing protein [Kofleriaceae bacterium]|nr:DUF503 domain-containing protein [Kofleriaceae bacterium]